MDYILINYNRTSVYINTVGMNNVIYIIYCRGQIRGHYMAKTILNSVRIARARALLRERSLSNNAIGRTLAQ